MYIIPDQVDHLMDTIVADSYTHITQIEIRTYYGHLHQLRINGIGENIPHRTNECVYGTYLDTLTLTSSQRITKIEFIFDI